MSEVGGLRENQLDQVLVPVREQRRQMIGATHPEPARRQLEAVVRCERRSSPDLRLQMQDGGAVMGNAHRKAVWRERRVLGELLPVLGRRGETGLRLLSLTLVAASGPQSP